MNVPQQRTKLLQKSLKAHIIAGLATVGWVSPSGFVVIGYIEAEVDELPVVGVTPPQAITKKIEIGSNIRRPTFLVDIEVKGQDGGQLTDLMDSIADNMNNIRIIDFNVAETTDSGYDAVAQTVARGKVEDDVRTTVVDELENSGRVSFRLRASKPF